MPELALSTVYVLITRVSPHVRVPSHTVDLHSLGVSKSCFVVFILMFYLYNIRKSSEVIKIIMFWLSAIAKDCFSVVLPNDTENCRQWLEMTTRNTHIYPTVSFK